MALGSFKVSPDIGTLTDLIDMAIINLERFKRDLEHYEKTGKKPAKKRSVSDFELPIEGE